MPSARETSVTIRNDEERNSAGIEPENDQPQFFVRQYSAPGQFFEFQLSSDGTAQTWRLPKKPSMDPMEKRLALRINNEQDAVTESESDLPVNPDHYSLWDYGKFAFKDLDASDSNGKRIKKGLVSGKMVFSLQGKKLKGEFSLRQIRYGENEAWMLVKKKETIKPEDEKQNTGGDPGIKFEKGENINILEKKTAVHGRKKLLITNPDKIYWPDEGITKSDLIKYYRDVSDFILPYLKNRPHLLVRHPDGISQKGFYQKDLKGDLPEWIKTVGILSGSTQRMTRYLVCTNLSSLIFMINMGCIEVNPWLSKISDLEKPVFMVLDLDPGENASFSLVRETALVINSVLLETGINSYAKTSGSSGIHIYIPLNSKYDFRISRNFAFLLVKIIHQILPDTTSLERDPLLRKDKIYLDYLQNKYAQSVAAPYSVRPVKGAQVSMPLTWSELKSTISPAEFTLKNSLKRLKKKGDIFKGVLAEEVNIIKCIKNLEAFYKL